MRKNDLIKKLQEIEGNPEVFMWNGYVGDVMPLSADMQKSSLVKESFEEYSYWLRLEEEYGSRKEIDKVPYSDQEVKHLYNKVVKWELICNTHHSPVRDKFKEHKRNILILTAKTTGKSHWDRNGTLSY